MRTEAPRAPLRLGAVILPGAAGQCGLRVPARRAGAGTAPPGRTGGSAALRSLSCGDSVVSHSLRAGRHAPAAPSTALSGAGGHDGVCSGSPTVQSEFLRPPRGTRRLHLPRARRNRGDEDQAGPAPATTAHLGPAGLAACGGVAALF